MSKVVMNIFLLCIVLPLLFVFNKCKKITLTLLSMLVIIIATGTEGISDYWAYYEMYINTIPYPNVLYKVISSFFSHNNFSYDFFRLCWITFALMCILYPAKNLLNISNQIVFLIIFMITQLCIEIIQIRHLMIVALFSLSFYILIKNRWYSKIIYLIIMVCAACVHQVAYLFIPLVGLPYFMTIRHKKYLIFWWIVLCVLLCAFSRDIVNFILDTLKDGNLRAKIEYYSMHDNMRWGYLLAFALHVSVIMIFVVFYKNIVNKKNIRCFCGKERLRRIRHLIAYILITNIYIIVVWPLIKIDMNYIRFFRVIAPTNAIFILACMSLFYKCLLNNQEKIAIKLLLFIYIVLCFYLYIVRANNEINIFYTTLMGKNWILGFW